MDSLARAPFLSCTGSLRNSPSCIRPCSKEWRRALRVGVPGSRRFRVYHKKFDFVTRASAGGNEGTGYSSEGAGNGSDGIGNENGRKEDSKPSLRDAFVRGSKRYYSNLVNDSKFELGFDIDNTVKDVNEVVKNAVGAGKQRATELQAELDEAKSQSQQVAAEAQGKYWPRFVEWNRWELWKVRKKVWKFLKP